ncbi:recombinase family protein [Streptomyces phaeochromogenes]|uniref:recombinase family protein n=1 Tax=Streptomyces phaeochromogenes TaxID=1923 RepID=UPI0036A9D131
MALPISLTDERDDVDYNRVSDDDRGAAEGVESQHEDCEEFGEEIGRPLAATYQDNSLSAFSGRERPQYQRLLADIARGRVASVIVWHADRLSRNVREALDFIDLARTHNVRLFSVQKGGEYRLDRASGRAELIDDINQAQKESGHKGERISLARKRQARTGAHGGGIRRFGWGVPTGRVRSKCVNPKAPLDEREYVDVPVLDMTKHRPDEADEIRLWADELLATRGNMAQLLRGIKDRGVLTVSQADGRVLKRGGLVVEHGGWDGKTVQKILVAPRVSGHSVRHGEIIKWNAWPAIIPEETRQALIVLFDDPARVTNPGNTPRWLVSKMARCPFCAEGTFTARGGSRSKGITYRCDVCHKGSQIAPDVDEYIAGVAVERLSRADLVDLIKPPRPEVDIAALRDEITELRRSKTQAALSYARGGIDMQMLETIKADTDKRIGEVRGSLAEATASSPLAEFLETNTVDAAFRVWEGMSIGRRRTIVRLLMDITLLKGAPFHRLDPATILITPKGRYDGSAAEAEAVTEGQ